MPVRRRLEKAESDIVANAAAISALGVALQFKGTIAVAASFPTAALVQAGWTYRITADVTDNDATKTNTGQSFLALSEIAWNGTDWSELGTETTATFIVATPATLAQGDVLAEVDTATIGGAAVVNLPAASATRVGKILTILDVSGAAGVGTAVAVTPNGTDEINGVNAAIDIDIAYGGYVLRCVQTGAATYGWVLCDATETRINTTRSGNWLAGNLPAQADVNNAASPYTVLAADVVLNILSTTGAVQTLLPVGIDGKTYLVKDSDGDAGTNTITITPNGAETIEGAANLTLLHNFDSVLLSYDATDTDWKVLHRVENNAVRAVDATIDMVTPAANVLQLDGGASRAFLIKEIQFVCTAGAALNGDVTVTVGTSVGGVEIAAAFPLTGLDTAGETYRVAMDGVFPAIAGNAALDISVTIGDTGGGATGTMTGYIIGEEV